MYTCYNRNKRKNEEGKVELSFPVVTSMHLQYIALSHTHTRTSNFNVLHYKNQNVQMTMKKKVTTTINTILKLMI